MKESRYETSCEKITGKNLVPDCSTITYRRANENFNCENYLVLLRQN